MEMDEAQAVLQARFLEFLECGEHLRGRQSKLRHVTTTLRPFARTTAGEFDAYTDIGAHLHAACHLGDGVNLVELLDDDEDTLPHLLRQQRQLDVALVLVAIAYDQRVALALDGDDGVQFGFGTRLQTKVELPAVRDYLLDDGLHLVYLDRVDDEVLALKPIVFAGTVETFGSLLDTVVENVGETQQHRRSDSAQRQFLHHIVEIHLLRLVLLGRDIDVAPLVHTEVGSSPSIDVVQFLCVLNCPLLHFSFGLSSTG